MTDLRRLWLEEAEKECRKKQRAAKAALDVLQDKTTVYARAIDALERVHSDAADVYAGWEEFTRS